MNKYRHKNLNVEVFAQQTNFGYVIDWFGYKAFINQDWFESNWFLIKQSKKIATITEIYEYEIDVTDYEDCTNEDIKSDIEHNVYDGSYNNINKDLIVQVNIDTHEG